MATLQALLEWLPPLSQVLPWVVLIYALGTSIFVLLDNRSPQSTFAWLFWFYIFPIGGVLIYLLFGRNRRAFSNERRLLRQEMGERLALLLRPIVAMQPTAVRQVRQEKETAYHRLLNLVRNNSLSALTLHNRVTILQDASTKYPQLEEDIRRAQHSIHLQYFIWQTDSYTVALKDLLLAKAREGVVIRLLYDAIGCFGTLKQWYINELVAGGVEVYPYSPVWHFHTIGYRNHRKIAVVDGVIGYTGGINIGQEHLDGGGHFAGWRDTHLRIEGEAVRILQAIFSVDWYNATGQRLDDESDFPPVEPSDAYSPLQIIASGPDSQWAAIQQLYFYMILSAQHTVYLQSPFLILDETMADALKSVALAGVKVHVMITARNAPNFPLDWAANTYAAEMVRAGVRIYRYEKGYLHAKTLSIDGEICSIGSANMDIRSFHINYELNAVSYDRALAQQLEADFKADLEYCREFSWHEYQKRSVLIRLRDSLSRLLSPLQ
jgi:cardiolipin synthase